MASSVYHTITVVANDDQVRKEALAHEIITPGQLLEINADEEAAKHSAAAGVLPNKLIALETQTPNAESSAQVDATYAAGDTLYYAVGRPGEVYYMFLAAGQTVVKGVTQLQSDGAGALTPVSVGATTLTNSIVGVAAQDLTAGGAATRCLVEIV